MAGAPHDHPVALARMFSRPILVLDTETTGLDPVADSIIDIAAILLDPETLAERKVFRSAVRPTSPINEGARRVHGLTAEALATAPSVEEVVRSLAGSTPASAILCGHNVAFDVGFLQHAFRRSAIEWPFDYHYLDTWTIAFFVLGARAVKAPGYSLSNLCSLFGIPREAKHSALEDARAVCAILRHLYAFVRGDQMEVLGQLHLRLP